VLDELFGVGARPLPHPATTAPAGPGDPVLRAVLEATDAHDSVEAIAAAAGLTVAQTRAALGRLELDGHLVRRDLGGWERAAR
jgi:hypothetical protein